jgi:hypothetical protein
VSIGRGMEYVRFASIGVGFGTRRAAVDGDEGGGGGWECGWGRVLRGCGKLVRNRWAVMMVMDEEREVRLLVLSLAMCRGHDWEMMLAEAVVEHGREDFKVVITRDLRMGSTDTILGFIN